jgi:transposase/O-antigen/teichoic acid export membrane protein
VLVDTPKQQGPERRGLAADRLHPPAGHLRDEMTSWWREPLLRNGHFLTMSSGMTALIGLVYWSLATHRYATDVVGRSAVVISAMMLIGGIGQMNLMSALVRFVPVAGRHTVRLVTASYLAAAGLSTVLGLGFLLVAPRLSSEFDFVTSSPWMSLGFVVSVAGWTIFVLQDSVLTGLRLTPLVSVENTLFSTIKVAIVVVLAGLLPVTGIVVSWWVGLGMALIATNAYIFLWRLPRHTATTGPESLQLSRRTVTRFAAPDYIGGLCWLGVVSAVPLIVIAQVGARETAYFSVVWQIGVALATLGSNMGTSLVVETASDQSDLEMRWRRVIRHTILPLGAAVAVIAIGAPFILKCFGTSYSQHGTTLLRLLALAAIPALVTDTAVCAARSRCQTHTASKILGAVSLGIIGGSAALLPMIGIAGVGVACLVAESVVAATLLARRSWWLRDGHSAAEPLATLPQLRASIAGSRALVLLGSTMALVVFSTIALAAGVVWHARQPVTLSLVAIPVAVATLVFYTRTVRNAASDDAWAPEAGPPVSAGAPRALGAGTGVAAVESYDVLRVAEILPLLQHLDMDDLRVVRDYERSCRARRAILARVETLLELGDQSREPVVVPTTSFNRQPITEPTFVGAVSQPPPTSIVSSQPPPPPPPTPARPRTDGGTLRSGRRLAADLFSQGMSVTEIARRLGVARSTVSNWHGLWEHGGVAALASSPPPRLTAARLAPIREVLDRGPQASGYPTDAWTLAQVTEVIERLTGVRYEPNRVRRILRDRMGWEADRLVS